MIRILPLTLVVALTPVLRPDPAIAQQDRCQDMACRALGSFRSCDKPLNGAKVFSARVIGLSRDCSDNIVSLQIDDAKGNNLPAVVEIDLGACVFFSGKVGDATQIALAQPHSPGVRRYHLACNVW
jgi:hypothetical protein